ncbi:MAG: alpha/beta hydrolase [Desulfurococcus sp.]|uniref:alpha/beta fold hydrolase n=1 Tax=Desulfurococcus sp. TaxID=51678 RepID=UPI0031668B94
MKARFGGTERLLYSILFSDKYGPLLLRLYVGQLENVLRKAWYNKSLLTQEVLDGYKYPLKARDWDKGLYWVMRNRGYPDIKSELGNIKADVLIIHGRNDELVPLEHSTELYNLLASRTRVELVVIDQCGHLPHEEKPDLVLAEIHGFLGLQANQ